MSTPEFGSERVVLIHTADLLLLDDQQTSDDANLIYVEDIDVIPKKVRSLKRGLVFGIWRQIRITRGKDSLRKIIVDFLLNETDVPNWLYCSEHDFGAHFTFVTGPAVNETQKVVPGAKGIWKLEKYDREDRKDWSKS